MIPLSYDFIAWLLVGAACCGLTRSVDHFLWLIFYTRGDNKRFDSDWNRRLDHMTKSANSFCFALATGFVAAVWFRFMA